uniref:Secreted protein n=1 Tax=Oryza meridionalis TaxID=40149 RepID=A0A0E0E4G0_9ORYZ
MPAPAACSLLFLSASLSLPPRIPRPDLASISSPERSHLLIWTGGERERERGSKDILHGAFCKSMFGDN